MERRKKIRLGNEIVDGIEVPFQSGGEHWNEYLVEDGSVVKMKSVATDIVRIEGRFDSEGNPMYVVKSTNIVVVSAPEKLRRQPE
jgi:hypothetical protein